MVSNSVVVSGNKRPINGNVGMLFAADDISLEEKIILRSYLTTTSSLAGSQAYLEKRGGSFTKSLNFSIWPDEDYFLCWDKYDVEFANFLKFGAFEKLSDPVF